MVGAWRPWAYGHADARGVLGALLFSPESPLANLSPPVTYRQPSTLSKTSLPCWQLSALRMRAGHFPTVLLLPWQCAGVLQVAGGRGLWPGAGGDPGRHGVVVLPGGCEGGYRVWF